MSYQFWSEEQLDEMRRLWNDEGLTSGEIARIFGTTRNAVLGLTHRKAGFAARGQGAKPKGMGAATPRGRPARAAATLATGREAARCIEQIPLSERRAAAERDLPSTDDLCSPRGCRWPIGDPAKAGTNEFRFCQRSKQPGSPYCDVHHEVAFDRVPSKRRRSMPGPHSEWA